MSAKQAFFTYEELIHQIGDQEHGPMGLVIQKLMKELGEKEHPLHQGKSYKELHYLQYPFTNSFASSLQDEQMNHQFMLETMRWMEENLGLVDENSVIAMNGCGYRHTFKQFRENRLGLLDSAIDQDEFLLSADKVVILNQDRNGFVMIRNQIVYGDRGNFNLFWMMIPNEMYNATNPTEEPIYYMSLFVDKDLVVSHRSPGKDMERAMNQIPGHTLSLASRIIGGKEFRVFDMGTVSCDEDTAPAYLIDRPYSYQAVSTRTKAFIKMEANIITPFPWENY